MGAGSMRDVLAFDARQQINDGAGNLISGPWEEQCKAEAEVIPLRGSETVIASRLTGVQPFSVAIRYTLATRQITTDWRARDVRSGKTYAIKTAVTRTKMDKIDMLCVEGLAE